MERDVVPIEELSQPCNALAAENTEDFTLLLRELRRSLPAERGEVFSQEGLNSRKTEMGKSGTVIQEGVNSLV